MTMSTAFTRLLGIQHPIALAPMGGFAGGALTAAVSNGGGLGLLGGGNGDQDWLARELTIVAEGTSKPWGVGFQSWAVDTGTVERALRFRPAAVMLSFGDPTAFVELIRQADATLRPATCAKHRPRSQGPRGTAAYAGPWRVAPQARSGPHRSRHSPR